MSTPIRDTNYRNKVCKLVDLDGEQAHVGDVLTDFRGETAILRDGRAPHKVSSSGFVYTDRGQSYAGVFDLRWVEES